MLMVLLQPHWYSSLSLRTNLSLIIVSEVFPLVGFV
ncbi:unnamed protein product [Arabidopsis halleri]